MVKVTIEVTGCRVCPFRVGWQDMGASGYLCSKIDSMTYGNISPKVLLSENIALKNCPIGVVSEG